MKGGPFKTRLKFMIVWLPQPRKKTKAAVVVYGFLATLISTDMGLAKMIVLSRLGLGLNYCMGHCMVSKVAQYVKAACILPVDHEWKDRR